MDWLDTTRRDSFSFEMLDPHDFSSRGWMQGYISGGISEGYYTDARQSASLDFVDSGYIHGSLIRVHHSAEGYENALGTFMVTDLSVTESNGRRFETFSCNSVMQRAISHLTNRVLTFWKQTASSAWNAVCEYLELRTIIDGSCPDSWLSSPVSWDVGEGYTEVMNALADAMGARYELDGDGNVLLSAYVSPSYKTPMFELSDEYISGAISITDRNYGKTNQMIVSHTDGDYVIAGDAWLPSSDPSSYEQTGYAVSEHRVADELSPNSKLGAQREAQRLLDMVEGGKQYSMTTLYVPIRCGDVVSRDCKLLMLQSRDINLSPGMLCNCTFKEV